MGFTELKNAPSMYRNEMGVLISIHVDDPLIAFPYDDKGDTAYDWFFDKIKERYDVKAIHVLTPDSEVDYCSLRIRMNTDGSLLVDNDACIDRILEDADMADCNPNKRSIHKEQLKAAYEEAADEVFVSEKDKQTGEANWIAQTTHPAMSVHGHFTDGIIQC